METCRAWPRAALGLRPARRALAARERRIRSVNTRTGLVIGAAVAAALGAAWWFSADPSPGRLDDGARSRHGEAARESSPQKLPPATVTAPAANDPADAGSSTPGVPDRERLGERADDAPSEHTQVEPVRRPSDDSTAKGLTPEEIRYYLSILSHDTSPSRRAFAILYLRHATRDPNDSGVPQALLVELTRGTDSRFRVNATMSLAYLVNRGVQCPGACKAMGDAIFNERSAAVRDKLIGHALGLMPIKDRAEVFALYRRLLTHPSAAVRSSVAETPLTNGTWNALIRMDAAVRKRIRSVLDDAVTTERDHLTVAILTRALALCAAASEDGSK